MTHVVACALYCDPPTTHGPTSPWTVAGYLVIGAIVAVVCAVKAKNKKARR